MARTLRAAPSSGGFHPHAVRRCAPDITRIQRINPPASKLASGFTADPPLVGLTRITREKTMNSPMLLAAYIEKANIILRIDLDPENDRSTEDAIRLLTVRNCSKMESACDQLQKGIGKSFEYEMFSRENILSYSSDYHEEVEIACDGWTELSEPATIEDLLMRVKYLASQLHLWSESYYEHKRSYEQLRSKLETAINQGCDRAERKLSYYGLSNPAKTEAIRAQKRIYEHFRLILKEETKI
jgi:hypothetical protein